MGLINIIIKQDSTHQAPLVGDFAQYFNNTSGFRKLGKKDSTQKVAKKLMDNFNKIIIDKPTGYYNGKKINKVEVFKHFKHPSECKDDNEKQNISAQKLEDKNGRQYFYTKCEDNLERFIKLSFDRKKQNCINQVPIPDIKQASHIDLLLKSGSSLNFVELKQWENGANPPTWAVAEAIKNLYMFLHFNVNLTSDRKYYTNKIKKFSKFESLYDLTNVTDIALTILAPEKYYDVFNKDAELYKKYKEFCEILETSIKSHIKEKLRKDINIKIETKYLVFDKQSGFRTAINRVIDLAGKTNISIDSNTGEINLDSQKSGEINIFDKLIEERLIDINKLTEWKDIKELF